MKPQTKSIILRILILILLEGLLLFFGFYALLIAFFSGSSFYPIFIAILIVIFAISFPVFIFGLKVRKYALPFYILLVLTVPSAIGIKALYKHQDDKVPVLYDGIDVGRFKPFSDDVAKLPKESSLKLTDSLPVLDGALALYPVYSAFATALYPKGNYPPAQKQENMHPVHFTNTVAGFEGLLDGRVDIFFMAKLSDAQMEMAKEKGIELVFTPIGKEAFVFFVNRKNPVQNITIEDIRKIYSGKIANWRTLGGKGKIKAFQRNKNSGSQSALEHLMAGEKLMTPPQNERPGGMGGIVRQVASYKNYKGSLGFSFRFFTTEMAQNDLIKLLAINGVAPTEENVRNGSYPIISPIYAITRKNNSNPNVERMLDWMVSEEGQYLVRETGYTPILKINDQ